MNRASWWAKLALVFVAAAGLVHAQSPKAQPAKPAVVVQRFYEWYLQSLARDRDPLTQERAALKTYVSETLIKELDRRSQSPDGFDEDYFLKAQDYFDEWKGHISVEQAAGSGTGTTVAVTLGVKGPSLHRLRVELKNESVGWRLTRVQAAK